MKNNTRPYQQKSLFSKFSGVIIIGLLSFSTNAFAYYNAFSASEAPYISGSASDQLPWQGENFESYLNGQTLECSNSKASIAHFDVTSGCLSVKDAGSWRRGWTNNSSFRVVAIGQDASNREIKWTNQTVEYRGYIKNWHSGNIPNWSGLHAFARYRDSDNLYVASIRYDGKATIKRKWKGKYTTLVQTKIDNTSGDYLDENGKLMTGKWYRITFSVIGNELKLYLDGKLVLSTTNGTFSWGTMGIRTDKAATYIDNWKLFY